jgi:hypothetical protein
VQHSTLQRIICIPHPSPSFIISATQIEIATTPSLALRTPRNHPKSCTRSESFSLPQISTSLYQKLGYVFHHSDIPPTTPHTPRAHRSRVLKINLDLRPQRLLALFYHSLELRIQAPDTLIRLPLFLPLQRCPLLCLLRRRTLSLNHRWRITQRGTCSRNLARTGRARTRETSDLVGLESWGAGVRDAVLEHGSPWCGACCGGGAGCGSAG